MPKVPVQQLQEVKARPLAQNRMSAAGATPDAFGAAIGRAYAGPMAAGIAHLGDAATDIGEDMKQRDQTRALLDLNTAWQAAKRNKLYGTTEQPGYFGTKGATAVAQAGQVDQDLEEMRQQFIKDAPDAEVAFAFEKASMSDLEESRGQIARHTMVERKNAETASRQASVAEARQAAAADPANPAVLADAMFVATMAAKEQAEADGLDEIATLSLIEQEQTGVLKDAIVSLSRTDAAAAHALFEANKERIDGDTRSDLQKSLEDVGMAENVQAVVDHVMSLGMSPEESRDYIRGVHSGKLEDESIQALNARYNELYQDDTRAHLVEQRAVTELNRQLLLEEKQKEAAYDAASEHAFEAMNSGMSWEEYIRAEPENYKTLSTRDVKKYQEAANLYAQGLAFAVTSDGTTYTELLKRSPSDLANTNLTEYQPFLTQKEWTDLDRKQKGAVSSMERKDKALYPELERLVKRYAPKSAGYGKDNANLGPKERAAQNYLTHEMNAWLTEQLDAGKNPTRADLDAKAQDMVIEAVKPDTEYFNGDDSFKGPAGLARQRLTPEQKQFVIVKAETMPPQFRTAVERKMRELNMDVTDTDLMEEIGGAIVMGDIPRLKALNAKYGR